MQHVKINKTVYDFSKMVKREGLLWNITVHDFIAIRCERIPHC